MSFNANSQAVKFVESNGLYRSCFTIGQDHGFADKLGFGLFKRIENGGRAKSYRGHVNSFLKQIAHKLRAIQPLGTNSDMRHAASVLGKSGRSLCQICVSVAAESFLRGHV